MSKDEWLITTQPLEGEGPGGGQFSSFEGDEHVIKDYLKDYLGIALRALTDRVSREIFLEEVFF